MASATVGPRRRRSSRSTEAPRARFLAYLGTAVVIGLIVATVVLDAGAKASLGPDLIVWSLLASVGAMSTVDLGQGRPALSMDLPVLLACAFAEGPAAAGIVAFAGTFDQFELRGQSSVTRILSNHSQTALSVMAAGWVFMSVGGLEHGLPVAILAATLALAADIAVNYTAVAVVQGLLEGERIREVVAAMKIGSTLGFMASYMAFGFLSLLVTVAYEQYGFGGVLVCLAPLVLAREAFAKTHSLQQENSRVQAQALALARVDERIADERYDERAQIAAALHDEVLQCLYNVRIRAEVIREDFRSGRLLELEDDVPALVDAAEGAAEELRDVIRGLRRSPIGRTGLADTVTLLANYLRDESGINFVLKLETVTSASPDVELLAYQILREAMSNAVKHSHADTVWVSIGREDRALVLEVLDNGIGFVPSLSDQERHFGLPLMRERAELGGGTLDIRSQPGQGAVVAVRLPLT